MEHRHLRYFVAVVQGRGFREASRRLHVAQPAISQTLANLEEEIGVKLFLRSGRGTQLTPEGEIFYAATLRTLAQSELAVEEARRAARGEIGTLSIGFLGSATYTFLPDLVRRYKAQYPGVKLILQELTSWQQEREFKRGELDVGFTRALSAEQSNHFHSKLLYRDPLLAAVPAARRIKAKRMKIADLANDPFVLYHRDGAPGLFDTITGVCNEAGFSPKIDYEPEMMQTVLSLVSANCGVSLVPACVRHLRTDGVNLFRVQPDQVRIDLVIAWPKTSHSHVLRSFLDLVESSKDEIQQKTKMV